MTTLKNLTIYTEKGILEHAYIQFDKKIINIGTGDIEGIDMDGKIMIPGFIDQHIHGSHGADVMDATPRALEMIALSLPQEGVTSFLATTMTDTKENIIKALENVNDHITQNEKPTAECLGIHLEGPFISPIYKGAQRADAIQMPDIELFKTFLDASGHHIKQVTLAPEIPNALPLIDFLKTKSIVTSIGHSNATYEDVKTAIEHGSNCFTHAYSAMSKFHHRDIGIVGGMFLHDESYAELICDLIHTSAEAAKILYRQKTDDKIILITDAMRAKGLSDGTYSLGGQKVIKSLNAARLEDGTLAGSALKYDQGVRNFKDVTQADLTSLIKVASENPAKLHNLFHRKGSIAIGKDADLLIISPNIDIIETYCKGVRCY